MSSLPPGLDFSGVERLNNSTEDAELLAEILEKIRKPFEDLESLIVDLADKPRIIYLNGLIIASLLSSDPVKSLQDSVDLIRTTKIKNKLMSYISMCNAINPINAEGLLIETFKTGKYYRNRIKFRNK